MEIKFEENLYIREKYLSKLRGFYHETSLIKVISGVRRCGKSSLMQMIMKELLASGVSQDNILYFHLDTRAYLSVTTAEKLDKLISDNATARGVKYLFIDEIQNVKGFEKVLNAWREEGNVSIFITGSNSYLLSGELVTKLTGRYIELEMFPLTYEEYIEMKKFLDLPIASDIDELNNFILDGGFPFTVRLAARKDKRLYCEELIEEIFQKDIKQRLKVKNRVAFDSIMRYLIANFGSPTNLKNIVSDLNAKGVKVKLQTAYRYVEALQNAKVIIRCDRFDMNTRKSIQGEQKYYLSDLSIYFALNTNNKINYGPVLENIIHNYASSYGYKMSIGRIGKFECDFIARSKENEYAYLQVAYTILSSEETEEREYRPLEAITWDNYPRYVLTTDKLLQKRNGIKHLNIMDFMKSGEKI